MDPADLYPVNLNLNALAELEDSRQTCARPRLFSHSSFRFGFGCRRLTCGQPTNHLDLEGLGALMLTLNTWNRGNPDLARRALYHVRRKSGSLFLLLSHLPPSDVFNTTQFWVCGTVQC